MGNSNNNGKLLGAIVLGAAIGGVLGILFAPAKGSDTRKKLVAKGNDLTDSVKEKYAEIMDKFKAEIETIKAEASELVSNGKAFIKEVESS